VVVVLDGELLEKCGEVDRCGYVWTSLWTESWSRKEYWLGL
jgi:hypothetical protein